MKVAVRTTRHILRDWDHTQVGWGHAITFCGRTYDVNSPGHGKRLAHNVVVDRSIGGQAPCDKQTYAEYCTKLGEYVCGGWLPILPPSTERTQIVATQDRRTPGPPSTIPPR